MQRRGYALVMNSPDSLGAVSLDDALAAVRAKHGHRFGQIEQDYSMGIWIAIEHPDDGAPYPVHYVMDHTLAGLDAKLDAQ
jgi:hypothetical protein